MVMAFPVYMNMQIQMVQMCCARWTENGKHDEYLESAYFYGSGVYEYEYEYVVDIIFFFLKIYDILNRSEPKKKVWLAEHALNWNIISIHSRHHNQSTDDDFGYRAYTRDHQVKS